MDRFTGKCATMITINSSTLITITDLFLLNWMAKSVMCCRALLVKLMSMYMCPWRREKVPDISSPLALTAGSHTFKNQTNKCLCTAHILQFVYWLIKCYEAKRITTVILNWRTLNRGIWHSPTLTHPDTVAYKNWAGIQKETKSDKKRQINTYISSMRHPGIG